MYKIKLETSGKIYKQSAETIEEAMELIGLEWNDIKGKGLLTITKGKLSHEHLFNTVQLRRFFGSKLRRELWAKRLNILLESK